MRQKNRTSSDIKMLLSGSVGNIMEWYDFAVYGFMAKTIAPLFFPTEDKTAALISMFGVFAAGFLMRPIGAIMFGRIGDIKGRKKALVLSVILMAISTVGMGLIPTHATIGMAAPILLTFMRLLQGLSVGGELTTSISFIVEKAPPGRRGYYGAWTTFSAVLGILIGSAVGAAIESIFTTDQISDWVWRLPFLLGFFLGLYSLILRESVSESETFEKLKESGQTIKSPLAVAFKSHGKTMLKMFGTLWIFSVGFYMPFIYLPTYLSTEDKIPMAIALDINSLAMVLLLILTIVFGIISDKIGRKKVLILGSIGFIVSAVPVYYLFATQNDLWVFAGMAVFAFFSAAGQGVVPAFISEHFPGNIRVSAMSFSYNVAVAVFGGTTPLLCAWLIGASGSVMAPAWYLAFAAFISLLSVLTLKETYKDELE